MADKHVEICSGSTENISRSTFVTPLEVDCFSPLDQFLSYDSRKNRFSWHGMSNDLEEFIEDRLMRGDDKENVPELTTSSNVTRNLHDLNLLL